MARRDLILPLLMLGIVAAPVRAAQTPPAAPPTAAVPTVTLDAARRRAVIEKVGAILDRYYYDPALAAKMKAHLAARSAAGAYDAVTSGDRFAALLTRDLKSVANDLHLAVMFSPAPRPETPEEALTPAQLDARDARMRGFFASLNYGVTKAEVLPGNVGYLEVRGFPHPDWAGEAVASAFAFVANTRALILDLRDNAGGYPSTVALWAGYLHAPRSVHGATEDTHLFDQYDHRDRTTRQFWTAPGVPGKRYLDRPVYVLVGERTFSGGEIFADAVKSLKRGTLVGGRTAGGSNSVLERPIDAHFRMGVSFGSTTNAITKTSLEGKGVAPDIDAPRRAARETAHLLALKSLAASEGDPGEKRRLAQAIQRAEQEWEAARPRPSLTGNTEFRLKGRTDAKAVYLAGGFNGWDGTALPMAREADGWVARIDLPPGRHPYKFVIDGAWTPDPDAPRETDFTGNENAIKVVTAPK